MNGLPEPTMIWKVLIPLRSKNFFLSSGSIRSRRLRAPLEEGGKEGEGGELRFSLVLCSKDSPTRVLYDRKNPFESNRYSLSCCKLGTLRVVPSVVGHRGRSDHLGEAGRRRGWELAMVVVADHVGHLRFSGWIEVLSEADLVARKRKREAFGSR